LKNLYLRPTRSIYFNYLRISGISW